MRYESACLYAFVDTQISLNTRNARIHRYKRNTETFSTTVLVKVNVKVKVKVKFSLEQAMKAQRGSRSIALLFL
jgi:hypothetical protein